MLQYDHSDKLLKKDLVQNNYLTYAAYDKVLVAIRQRRNNVHY